MLHGVDRFIYLILTILSRRNSLSLITFFHLQVLQRFFTVAFTIQFFLGFFFNGNLLENFNSHGLNYAILIWIWVCI